MKRVIIGLIVIGLALTALFACLPVYAATAYSAAFTITESSGNDYTQLAISHTVDNTTLVNLGYMASTGLDARVKNASGTGIPTMVCTDKVLTCSDISDRTTNHFTYTTGNSARASMDIITGYGGKITISDANATGFELGNNFALEFKGYINTAAGASKYLINKSASFLTWVSSAGYITSAIAGTGLIQQTDTSTGQRDMSAYLAQTFTTGSYSFTVTTIDLYLTDDANTATISIKAVDGNGKPTGSALTSAAIGSVTTAGWYTANVTDYTLAANTTYAITSGLVNNGTWSYKLSNPYANGSAYTSPDNTNWTICTNEDLAFKVNGIDHGALTVTGAVNSGLHTIKTTADTTNFKLFVDDMNTPVDTESLGAASAPDNDNEWVFMDNSTTDFTPYWEYYKHTVSSTLIAQYQPVTIISSTTLPDVEGTAQNATITFGSNPAGIATTLGSFYPTSLTKSQLSSVASSGAAPTDTPTMPVQMYTELDTSKMPGGDIVAAILGVSSTPVALWWFPFIFLGLIIFAMLVFDATQHNGGEGSILVMAIIIEVGLVFFGVLGATGVSGMLPLWCAYLFPIPAAAIMLSRRHVGWG